VISVRRERAVSFSIDYLDIYWEIEPTLEDVQEYEFYLERSEAENGPWIRIAGPLVDRYHVRDNNTFQISANRVLYYRIITRHIATDTTVVGDPFDQKGRPTVMAQEIIRLENVLFSEFVGSRVWIFPRRTFGQRCPQCYDDVLQRRIDDSCPTCWGTSFSGGYHYPVETWAQIDEPPEATEQALLEDHRQTYYFALRTGPTPELKPLDLVIDYQNRRYRIISVGGTSRFSAGVRQEVKMLRIQRGAIEDAIPLRIPTTRTNFLPIREFESAATLESAKLPGLDTLLGAYGVRRG
jgi:hypothetical protein